jgi:hypothetical protein
MRLHFFPASIAALALSLVGNPNAVSQAVTLTPSADTSLFESALLNNLGGLLTLAAGETASHGPARALIKFDIANSVPPGAQILSANLTVTVVKAPSFGQPSTFRLYRVLADWGEGTKGTGATTGTGAVASPGEAT